MWFGTIWEKNTESFRERTNIPFPWVGWVGLGGNLGRHGVAFHLAWLLGSIFGQSTLTLPGQPRCSLLSLRFGCFLQPVRLQFIFLGLATTKSSHVPHKPCSPCTLCCTSLCTLADGLGCFSLSCLQMPNGCHMQLPSGSALYRDGWQLSPCFCPIWGTRIRMIWAPASRDARVHDSITLVGAL